MENLRTLGIRLNHELPLDVLFSETFNGNLYGMTRCQIGKVKALREIVTRYGIQKASDTKPISKSRDAAMLLYGRMKDLGHEEVHVAYLNKANKVIDVQMLFKGSLSSVLLSPRTVVANALCCNASACILYHNHPSGNPKPGTDDIMQTKQLKEVLKMMEIVLLDHIVISHGSYYSFADETVSKIR